MSYINKVTAAIGKFQELTHHEPLLAEALTEISGSAQGDRAAV